MKSLQVGDTIVEVLLAMSVIGLVLGASFGIANRSVQLGQDAQERTEALKIAESQLEIFKSEFAANNLELRSRGENAPFCLDTNTPVLTIVDSSGAQCSNINGNGQSGFYSVSIIPPPVSNEAYEFKVTWLRLGATSTVSNANTSNLSLFFKPGAL